MKTLLTVLFVGATFAQSLFINAGGIASGIYSSDSNYIGGFVQSDTIWGSGILKDVRYGTSFSYKIEVPNGNYTINVITFEPNNQVAGKRTFTISVNDYISDAIDVYVRCGFRNRCEIPFFTKVTDGNLRISFKATLGNAVVSAIEITPAYIHYTSCSIDTNGLCEVPAFPFFALPPQPPVNMTQTFFLMVQGVDPNVHPLTNLKLGDKQGPLLSFITQQPLPVQLYKLYQVWYLDGKFQAMNVP